MDRALPVRAGAGPEIGPLLSGLHAAPVRTTKPLYNTLFWPHALPCSHHG